MSQVNVQATAYKLNGDLRALALVYNSDVPLSPSEELISTIDALLEKTKLARKQTAEADLTGEGFMILFRKTDRKMIKNMHHSLSL